MNDDRGLNLGDCWAQVVDVGNISNVIRDIREEVVVRVAAQYRNGCTARLQKETFHDVRSDEATSSDDKDGTKLGLGS